MTTGLRLKKLLGMDQYTDVRIARVVDIPYRFYIVFYDSTQNFPVTYHRIIRSHRVATLLQGGKVDAGILKHMRMMPPEYIEHFNGEYKSGYIMLVDLAGDWMPQRRKYTQRYESVEPVPVEPEIVTELSTLYEEQQVKFTLIDVYPKIASHKNIYWYKDREAHGKTGSFLYRADFSETEDALLLTFRVTPTHGDSAKKKVGGKKDVKVTTMPLRAFRDYETGAAEINWKLSTYYTVYVMFTEVSKNLEQTVLRDLLQPKHPTAKERLWALQKVVKNCPIKIHSNDFSYYWQGTWEQADKYGFAIFEFTGSAGDGTWVARHQKDFYLTKHLLEVFKVLPFLGQLIARKLDVVWDVRKQKEREKRAKEKERAAREKERLIKDRERKLALLAKKKELLKKKQELDKKKKLAAREKERAQRIADRDKRRKLLLQKKKDAERNDTDQEKEK